MSDEAETHNFDDSVAAFARDADLRSPPLRSGRKQFRGPLLEMFPTEKVRAL
jgi:hypothetical protein